MGFRILGPVEVCDDGRPVAVGGPRQYALLAVLLVHANRVVATDCLVEHLWAEDHPRTARASVHNAVAALRRTLATAGPGAGEAALLTQPPGYLLRVPPGGLDADAFEELAASGERLAVQGSAAALEEATARLGQALAWWRGPALAGVDLEVCRAAAVRLEERRLAVVEQRADIELRLGRGAGLVAELRALVTAHPLRERLWAQLMLALYAANRQADALAAYRDLRAMLVGQLGVEPCPTLRRIQQAILCGSDPGARLHA